jgi:hypothetical protein
LSIRFLRLLFLTSLLGRIRPGAKNDDDDVSSTDVDGIGDEPSLKTDVLEMVTGICTLFFLSKGLRGGRAGGRSWPIRRVAGLWDDRGGLEG